MEVDDVIEMFARLHNVKYINYIVMVTKIFKALLDNKSYGDELPITKKECVKRVKKRMGFQLRAAKKKIKDLVERVLEN